MPAMPALGAAIGATRGPRRGPRGSHKLGMGCCFGPCGPSVDRLSAGSVQAWRHFLVVRDMGARELIDAGLGGDGRGEVEGKTTSCSEQGEKEPDKG